MEVPTRMNERVGERNLCPPALEILSAKDDVSLLPVCSIASAARVLLETLLRVFAPAEARFPRTLRSPLLSLSLVVVVETSNLNESDSMNVQISTTCHMYMYMYMYMYMHDCKSAMTCRFVGGKRAVCRQSSTQWCRRRNSGLSNVVKPCSVDPVGTERVPMR